jgi:dimethylhistidine N-methyltransferase
LSVAPTEGPDEDFLADVLRGLAASPKRLPPKYFYDDTGSRLFEEICRTPEYYPTRSETALLGEVAGEIAAHIPPRAVLVEFGSGASEKTRLLLDAAPQLAAYLPVDISADALAPAAARIQAAYPQLQVQPVFGDFTRPLALPANVAAACKVGFFPGSTIGNFDPGEARGFLQTSKRLLGAGALFVVGVDLVKDPAVLIAAYNDAEGVTAAFNLNLLTRMNRELGADFDLDRFSHGAVWNTAASRIEMHLVSMGPQLVRIAGQVFRFADGESIHTENSYKYEAGAFIGLAEASGWRTRAHWISPPPQFAVFLLEG